MYSEITSNKRRSILLVTIFIAIIIALGWVFDQIYGTAGSYSGIILAIVISFGMTTVSYFSGDKIALAVSGARQITREENKYLYNLVDNLCIATGTPVPKIYIIEDPAINAFATGRKPELASIAVTRGAIEKLENEELEGVLAHELSHIKNYDIRFMMLVAVLVGSISIISNIMLRSRLYGGRRSNNNSGGNAGGILLIVGIILAILSPIIAEVIKLAISRRREYLADASGALVTRYPEGLAKALEKIAAENQPLQRASQATAPLYISNPLSGKKISGLFSTHPPIEDRIKKLREMGG
ncbi:MAG: M48 family metallopeptidase [bacterium]|nr:M48 family metallopeptidase [bacterium]